jgi:pimeloyl-ACP methyl ester carboxylesterase
VIDRPDVRYAHNGDVAIAYQVFGQGPVNLVCVPGFISNLYWNWELPEFSRMLTGLGSFARVVILDRRGVGLSDRLYPKDLPPLEVVMDDVVTVMDQAGIGRAAVFGWQSGATHAALLAATYPARVTQLVTFNLDPCPLVKPGWPHAWSRSQWESQALGAAVGELGLDIRAGCHTGEIELAGDRIRGLAVHISARVGALACAGEILVSSTVKDLTAGSGLQFEDAGEHELKGVPNQWHLYRVRN